MNPQHIAPTVTCIFTSAQLQQIQAHAERTYPEECCGLLLGRRSSAAKVLLEVRPVPNAWSPEAAAEMATVAPASPTSAKTDRYWIDPQDLLKAQRDARDRQIDIIGIYHSHPDHPAVPSECDRALAWAAYTYLIVSVQQGSAQDVRAWVLDGDRQFQAEAIVLDA